MTSYEGKRAVVIGGTHGMGLAIARGLAAGGAHVLLTGRNEAHLDAARATVGPVAEVVQSDVASMADIASLADLVRDRLGQVDALFVNVGLGRFEPFSEVTEEVYDRMFAVNTKGPFFAVQRLAPLIVEGGAVVFTTVTNGAGTPGLSVYSGAKGAVREFVKVLGAELVARQIRVNAVAPGFIDTPTMGVPDASEEERSHLRRLGDDVTPMRRHGTADEVARAALFLAFEATFTTGVELPVDGGLAQLEQS